MATARQKFKVKSQATADSVARLTRLAFNTKVEFSKIVTVDLTTPAPDRLEKTPDSVAEIRLVHSGTNLVIAVTVVPFTLELYSNLYKTLTLSEEALVKLKTEQSSLLSFYQLGDDGIPQMMPVYGFESANGLGDTFMLTPDLDTLHKKKILPLTVAQVKHLLTVAQVTRMSSSRIEVPINVKYKKS